MKSVLLLLFSLSILLHSSLSEYKISYIYIKEDKSQTTTVGFGSFGTITSFGVESDDGLIIRIPSFFHPDFIKNLNPKYIDFLEKSYFDAKKNIYKFRLFYYFPWRCKGKRFYPFFHPNLKDCKIMMLGGYWKSHLEYSLLISEENHELSKRIFSDSEKVLSKRKIIYYSDEYKRNKDYFIFIKGLHYYLDEDYFNAIVFFEAFFKRYIRKNRVYLLSLSRRNLNSCEYSDILFFLDTLYYLIKSYKIIEDDNYKSGLYIIYAFKSLLLHRIDYKEAYEIWSHKKEIEEMLHEIDFDSIEIEIEKNITEE